MQAVAGTTESVAAWVAGLRIADIPEAARGVLRHALLDTLGCGLHGSDLEWSRIVRRWAGAGGRPAEGAATVWGEAAPLLRPADAALVNGVSAHAFELDDFHPTKLHPGAVVIPAALALGERLGADGAALLTAIAAGYEVMTRTSAALDPSAARLRGWHLTGVAGPFGAAAAAAVLLGLDARQTASALGLAGTQGSGLFAFNADGAMSKRFHAGDAARAGIVAAELAALGFTGPTRIYETEDGGFLAAHSPAADAARLTDGLGESWLLERTAFKPYACCGSLHAYVDAALALRRRLGAPPADSGWQVRIGLPKVVEVQCGFDYLPGSVLSAQMNARYCVAAALRDGAVLPAQFAAERLTDPDLLALAGRIEQQHDPALDAIYPANYCAWVEIEPGPGRPAERVDVHDASGFPANPGKDAAMRAKFHRLMESRFDAGRRARIEAAALNLETADAAGLVALLADPVPRLAARRTG